MKNVCQLASRSIRRKKARLREYFALPFVLLRIWWESPQDAAEEVRYIELMIPEHHHFSPPMKRIAQALRRRASMSY
jgi:hypothetical protein